jgi:hypothetical protein
VLNAPRSFEAAHVWNAAIAAMHGAGGVVTINVDAAHAIAGRLGVDPAVALELLGCMRQGLAAAMKKRGNDG